MERGNLRYSKLSSRDENDGEAPPRFKRGARDLRYEFQLPEVIPWKSIALAIFLLLFGTLFLLISYFIHTGHMEGDSSQVYGFLTLGIIVFLPGFYETRVAYYSWRGAKGYKYSKIPAY